MTDFNSQLKMMNSTVQSGQGIQGRPARAICKKCGRQIIATKEIVTTTGDVFHPEHFLCSGCNKALSTDMHYPFEGNYYCPACWETRCPVCAQCNKPILSGPKISAMGKVFHVEHFRCATCDCQLEESFAVRDGRPYCKEHALAVGDLTCARCGKPIKQGQYFNNSDGTKHWHQECFVCALCKIPFASGSHYELDGEIYCQLHYHTMRGSVCAGCGLPVVGDALEAQNSVYHINCFKCAGCQKNLKGLVYHLLNGKPHCAECTSRLRLGAK